MYVGSKFDLSWEMTLAYHLHPDKNLTGYCKLLIYVKINKENQFGYVTSTFYINTVIDFIHNI